MGLEKIRQFEWWFDLVLCNIHMPDVDGFKLLEMDLPMSADDHNDTVMKAIMYGAVDYLIKPVRMEQLKILWQHVVRKKLLKSKKLKHLASLEENDKHRKALEEGDNNKRKKREWNEEDVKELVDPSQMKLPPRLLWNHELHSKFVSAVNQLGIDSMSSCFFLCY